MKIYEVWRNTPYGDMSMGFYTNKDEATKHLEDFNSTTKSLWDKARITEREVKEVYIKETLSGK